MKYIAFFLIIMPLIASAFTQEDYFSWEARLFDGRVINAEKDVETIYFNEESIDAIDLFSGELVELDEIESLWLLEGEMASLAAMGVDGGG